MSIIYSYPATAPTLDDLLIGTDVGEDNATKSFTVQSLVALINAEAGSGTVTGITIATDAFLRATETSQPGAAAITYTLQLTATGTPSATTFLRGDNQWVVPTVSAGIGVSSSGVSLTTDVKSFNFTGEGVSTTASGNNVTVVVASQVQSVTGLTEGAGIGLVDNAGNITVSNTGVRQIIPGQGISISPAGGTGNVTIETTNQASGTVTSVTPGPGLKLISGSTSLDPSIGINYTGTQNYIIEGDSAAVAVAADKVMFNQTSSSNVKTSTLGTIPMTTLPLVKTYIDTADAIAVQNNTDTVISVAKVKKVITLLDSEYAALATKEGNTLYLTTSTAATQFTKTLNVINNVSGFANGSLSGSQTGATVTGPENSGWSFTTQVNADGGYSYSGSSPFTITGTFDNTGTVNSTVSGSITADSVPQCTSTLTTNSAVTPALQASYFTLTSGSTSTAACSAALNAASVFPVAYALTASGTSAGYTYTSAATTYSGNNGTYSNSASITGTANGTVALGNFTLTVNISQAGITVPSGTSSTISTSGGVSGSGNGSYTVSLASGTAYSQTTTIAAGANTSLSGVTPSNSQTASGTLTANTTINHNFAGTLNATTSSMSFTPNNSFSPAAAFTNPGGWGYSIDGGARTPGNGPATGTTGLGVTWTFLPLPPTVTSGYSLTSSSGGTASGVLGTNASVTGTVQAAASINRYASTIAGIGGTGGSGGSACSYSPAVTVYTDASASSGLSVGQTVYTSNTGSAVYSTNTSAWWKTGAPGGNQIVNFNSSGTVAATGSC
jgi:hypothetical protein